MLSSFEALYKIIGHKRIYAVYERPPFPIIIDKPSVHDLVSSYRFSDFVMCAAFYGIGIVYGYVAARPFRLLQCRLLMYHYCAHSFTGLGFACMNIVAYRRLTGFMDNGLRWRKPDDKLKKYDCTTIFERSTGWDRFRI